MERHLPPYAELADRLRESIAKKALPPGAWLGTEVALAEENGLSRMTARRAVQALVDEGLVERRAGRGVFVRGEGRATRKIRFVAGNLLWEPAVRVAQAVQGGAAAAGFEVSVFDGRDGGSHDAGDRPGGTGERGECEFHGGGRRDRRGRSGRVGKGENKQE